MSATEMERALALARIDPGFRERLLDNAHGFLRGKGYGVTRAETAMAIAGPVEKLKAIAGTETLQPFC